MKYLKKTNVQIPVGNIEGTYYSGLSGKIATEVSLQEFPGEIYRIMIKGPIIGNQSITTDINPENKERIYFTTLAKLARNEITLKPESETKEPSIIK